MKKTVSLVLGGGGARGLAHVGVIRWLEENDYEIKSISGCSIGALVGGFYAAEKLEKYVEWLEGLDTLSMLKLLDFKGEGGLVSGEKLMKTLKDLVGEHDIQDLPIKFTAVATDIDAEEEVWIDKGSLLDAIRASISLPLFFEPFKRDGKSLVDGGVLNSVPISPTVEDTTDMTIVVNLGAEPSKDAPLKAKKEQDEEVKEDIRSKLKSYMKNISLPDISLSENGMYIVANKSFDTMQGTIAKMKIKSYSPDVEIAIPRNLCGTFEYNLSTQIIEYGYNKCKESFTP
jgi:NTE family protein